MGKMATLVYKMCFLKFVFLVKKKQVPCNCRCFIKEGVFTYFLHMHDSLTQSNIQYYQVIALGYLNLTFLFSQQGQVKVMTFSLILKDDENECSYSYGTDIHDKLLSFYSPNNDKYIKCVF